MQLDFYIANTLVKYLEMMEPITPIFHLAYLVLLNRLIFFRNGFRSSFEWFVTLHYVMFLFLPFGWLWVQLGESGPAPFSRLIKNGIPFWFPGRAFGLSGIHFILIFVLATLWYFEAKAPKNDFDFRKVRGWNFGAVPVILWGFVYPFHPVIEQGGFTFLGISALWRSPFGVMVAPTSTFLLGLLTFIYPRVNMRLFWGTSAALFIIAVISIPSSPLEWPMGLLAAYNLAIGFWHLMQRRLKKGSPNPVEIAPPKSAPAPDQGLRESLDKDRS